MARLSMVDIKMMAAKGDAVSQFVLGNCYLRGEGVPANINEAAKWLIKAADQGNKDAKETIADNRILARIKQYEIRNIGEDKVVFDHQTGLMWQKDYEEKQDWEKAMEYAKNLKYAGYSDWRLPTLDELSTLVDEATPSEVASCFPGMPSEGFWSSSLDVDDTTLAWRVKFDYNNIQSKDKDYEYFVRCVH